MTRPPEPTADAILGVDAYALRVAAHLTQASGELPYDVTERLRAARMQALARRKRPVALAMHAPAAAPVAVIGLGGAAVLGAGGGGEGSSWWRAAVSALPLVALVAGLAFINAAQDDTLALEMAEVDSALLADDLPPSAYADPGFVQYLRVSGPTP